MVCASLQAIDPNKDVTEFVNRNSTGTEKPGFLAYCY